MVHFVDCSSCSTSFPVDADKVPPQGVWARCSACDGIFFVARPEAPLPTFAPTAETTGPEVEAAPAAPAVAEPSFAEPPLAAAEPEFEPYPEPEPEPGPAAAERDFDMGFTFEPLVPEAPAEPEPGPAADFSFELEPDPAAAHPALEMPHGDELPTLEEPLPILEEAGPDLGALDHGAIESVSGGNGAPEASSAPPPPDLAPSFTFGRRDPHEKARRLARVLVSDMIMYNPERHSRALAAGTLREDFDDEIRKSWEEYTDQVGEEIARATPYFHEALNDILARGERIFP